MNSFLYVVLGFRLYFCASCLLLALVFEFPAVCSCHLCVFLLSLFLVLFLLHSLLLFWRFFGSDFIPSPPSIVPPAPRSVVLSVTVRFVALCAVTLCFLCPFFILLCWVCFPPWLWTSLCSRFWIFGFWDLWGSNK